MAVRLPAEYARMAGIKDGDSIEAEIDSAGRVTLTPQRHFDKTAFLKKIQKSRAAMPMTSAAVEAMRSESRY